MIPNYVLLNKKRLDKAYNFDTAFSASCFLLGKRISEWVVMKIDDTARIVSLVSSDCHEIEKELKTA